MYLLVCKSYIRPDSCPISNISHLIFCNPLDVYSFNSLREGQTAMWQPNCQRSTANFPSVLFGDLNKYLDRIEFYTCSVPFGSQQFQSRHMNV